jgi:asparagine synthase (glutamine-hydrolysing)
VANGSLHDGVLVVVVGVIDDRAALAGEFHLPPDAPQHILAAVAYSRLQAGMLSRLRGAFALLVWDRRRREGILAVDPLGARSLFYRRAAGSFVFATDVRELLPLLETAPPPSEPTLVRWLVDGVQMPEETLLSGIERLPGGHLLHLGGGRPRLKRYWAPVYRPPTALDTAAAAASLRGAAERALARSCARGRPLGVLLSGGLDSTSVAALAHGRHERLAAYSATFPQHPRTDERVLIEARARFLGLTTAFVSFRHGGTLPATLRYLETWRVPPASPNLFFHEPLLSLAKTEGITTMLDGQGGDELFGLSPYLAADRFLAGRLREVDRLLRLTVGSRAARRAAFRQVVLEGALPYRAHRLAALARRRRRAPSWLTDVGADLYGDGIAQWQWKAARAPRWWAHLAHVITVGRERAGVHDWLRHAFAHAALDGAHPWLQDADLVETVLALPPEFAWDARYDRPMLREVLRGLLPDSIRLRADKSYFNDVLGAAVHVADAPAIESLLAGRTEVSRYVRPEFGARLRALPPSQWGRRETWLLWRLVTLECWLRVQADTDFIDSARKVLPLAEAEVDIQPSVLH